MKLSLSIRIVEAACKTKLNLPFEKIVEIAKETGYSAICFRASAGGVGTPIRQLEEMRKCVEENHLFVSMVTADSNVPLNGSEGPSSLRNIQPSLDVASALGCNLVRICMKTREDIPFARQATIQSAARGIRLVHQCHTESLFEQVDSMLQVLSEIDNPYFGIIYEPANLLLCGEEYGRETLRKLSPHLMNVYVQNHRLNPEGSDSLPTYCRGTVTFDHLAPWSTGGVDFDAVCSGLKEIGYQGTLTIHQAQGITTLDEARRFAQECSDYFHGRV